jgi:hypothetical protein
MRPYEAVFARKALEFLLRASDDEVAEIETWMRRIERAPHTPGDYTERDEAWRDLHVAVLDATAITYWADDAVCEVRICHIERLHDQRSRRR